MSLRLKRSGSNSSLASLSSRASQRIHVPETRGADFLDAAELRDRGTFTLAPLDTKRFKKLSQNVEKHEAIPEAVRNKRYNRHMDVLPNPATRVQLPVLKEDVTTSYVNANYVHGPDGNKKAYICAMGPLPASLKNWWRMVWQEKVTCMLMATGLTEKGTKKCERYWAPRPGQKVKVADMFVRTLAVSQGEGYVRTLLEIEHSSGESRKVMHFWYNTWPDHGVPRSDDGRPDAGNLLYMIRDSKRSEAELNKGGPILTHCSAGVGRSGTIIALDFACQLLEKTGKVDLCQVVEEIRKDRVALVQHPAQYELAFAGCQLYAQFVQANCETDPAVVDSGFTFVQQESAYGVAVANGEQVTNDDDYTGMEDANVPPVTDEGAYGTPVPSNPAAAVEPDAQNLYGTPVLPSSTSKQPPGEYSVMRGGNADDVPVAQEPATYTDPTDKPPMASDNVVYGDDEPPVAKAEVVYGDDEPVVIRANTTAEDDDDNNFGFDAAANGDIDAADFVNAKGKVVKKQVKSAVKDSERELSKLEQELKASENDVKRRRKDVTDQELLVQACQQRVENKQEQVNELKRRVMLASGSRQAADDEARSEVNVKRADAMLKAIGCIYTKSSADRHAKFMVMSMQPHKARQAAGLVGKREVRSRSCVYVCQCVCVCVVPVCLCICSLFVCTVPQLIGCSLSMIVKLS
eukprot:m.90347 g.90347  ORF g.90347 m.90347 type:complete len:689 (+) comp14877_c0_seq2:208-2274(+)